MKLTDDELDRVARALRGTCDEIDNVLDRLEIDGDANDIEDQLVDFNVERCSCGWWVESGELVDDDGELVGCSDCREPDADQD